MAGKISASKTAELKAQFKKLDTSKDGKLDFTEMSSLLRSGNPNMKDSELRVLFGAMDKNKDSRVSFEEFVDYIYGVEGAEEDATIPASNEDVKCVYEQFIGGHEFMTGMQFAQLCRECDLHDKKFSKSEVDILFNKAKTKGSRGVTFRQFEKLLFLIAEKKGVPVEDIHNMVGDSAGHVAKGTKADAVRFHDDKSTYTGTKSMQRKGDIEEDKKSPMPPSLPSAAGRGRSPGPAGKDHGAPETSVPDDDLDWNELDKVFEAYLEPKFKDAFEMDNAHFVKLCTDCRLFDSSKFTKTDADIMFKRTIGSSGARRITFSQFVGLLKESAEKKGEAGYFTHRKVKANAGPVLHGTKADAVKFHDDKSLYTGAHAAK